MAILNGPPINSPIAGNLPCTPEWMRWFSQSVYKRIGGINGINASDVVNVPYGTVTADNTQSAINELDDLKLAKTGTAYDSGRLGGELPSAYAQDILALHRVGAEDITGEKTFKANIVVQGGKNFIFDATTGTQIGTSASEKIGFWGKTPVVRPAALTTATADAPAGGTGTADGGWDTAAHRDTAIALINNLKTRVGEIESRLSSIGILP